MGGVIVILSLPLMMIYNFIRNYGMSPTPTLETPQPSSKPVETEPASMDIVDQDGSSSSSSEQKIPEPKLLKEKSKVVSSEGDKKSSKAVLYGLLGVLAVALISVIAYLVVSKYQSKPLTISTTAPKEVVSKKVHATSTSKMKENTTPRNLTSSATVVSSSNLIESNGTIHPTNYAVDGQMDTAWTEGKKNDGIGEWIELRFPQKMTLTKLCVVPGYNKYRNDKLGDRFYKNNRIRKALLQWNGGERLVSFEIGRAHV